MSDFADGIGSTWVDLPGGRRIELKDELSYGEDKVLQGYAQKSFSSVGGDGDQYGPDFARWFVKRLATWIVNWDLTDKDGKPVPVSESAIRSLRPRLANEMDLALSQHIEEQLKNAPSAVTTAATETGTN